MTGKNHSSDVLKGVVQLVRKDERGHIGKNYSMVFTVEPIEEVKKQIPSKNKVLKW